MRLGRDGGWGDIAHRLLNRPRTATVQRATNETRIDVAVDLDAPGGSLTLSYDPDQLNNPEAMIAVFAHTLAHYLGTSASEPS